jgi:hypothetical protein
MSNYVKFNKSTNSKYALVMRDDNTVYFTPDTKEIILGNQSYGKSAGEGELTVQVNGVEKGRFNANASNDSTINITLEDLGLKYPM